MKLLEQSLLSSIIKFAVGGAVVAAVAGLICGLGAAANFFVPTVFSALSPLHGPSGIKTLDWLFCGTLVLLAGFICIGLVPLVAQALVAIGGRALATFSAESSKADA